MKDVLTPILFLALIANVPIMIAYLVGLKFKVEKPGCKEEEFEVNNNIRITKIVQVINVAIYVILFILVQCL